MIGARPWVMVWRDHNFTLGEVEELEDMRDYVNRSVGFLVHEDNDWFYLAQSLNNDLIPCEVLRILKVQVITKTPL